MSINTSQINSFLTVIREGSISKAADKLFITSPALIKQLNLLEAYVGVKLMNRTNRGISLTQSGQVFFDGVQSQMNEFEKLLVKTRKAANEQSLIRIGIFSNGATPQSFYAVLASFSKIHPEIKIELVPSTLGTPVNELLNEQIDFCLHYHVMDSEIGFIKISSFPFVCLMSSFHPLASRNVISKADLAGSSVFSYSGAKYSPALKEWCEEEPFVELIGESFSSIDDLMQQCINNKIFIVPQESSMHLSLLAYRPLDTDIQIEYGLIYRKNSLTSAGKQFLRCIK